MMTMDRGGAQQSFVHKVKATNVCFDLIDHVIDEIRRKNEKAPSWAIFCFTSPQESRNTALKTVATGMGDLSDRNMWPHELFAQNSLCYGLFRVDFPEDDGFAPEFVSFCWKGRNLPIYLRTRYAEYNQKHLGAITHVTLQHPDELASEGSVLCKQVPSGPRMKRANSRRFIMANEIEFAPEVLQAVKDIRSDSAPFNWVVCGVETIHMAADQAIQRLVVIEKGMSGLYGLKGLGGITAVLKEGCTMYIYLRVDIPLHHTQERIVSKFVMVTWQGNQGSSFSDEDSMEIWNFPPSDGPPLSSSSLRESCVTPSSKVQRVVTAHVHGNEIYRMFPHHVHFCASRIEEISEEAIRDRVRRAVDNDSMLVRVVCIQKTGDSQPPVCVEVPFEATVQMLRKEIALYVGIPEDRQRIVWIRQIDEFVNELQRSTHAVLLDDNTASLVKDVGLGHGDKIHVDDHDDGEDSVLERLVKQINSGVIAVSLSAERRHEVQRGVEAREAELKKILVATHEKIRRQASREKLAVDVPPAPMSTPLPVLAHADISDAPISSPLALSDRGSESSVVSVSSEYSVHEDVSNLQEQARVLEEQNQYLEIPYDCIRILSGKENELGCGKAATVYRGLWMSKNGAAEVAIKLFRYIRLTDKILGDYTKEVAMLRKLKHPNIVLFIGACTNPKLMILTEYCSRKSLYEVIHSPNFASIPWKFIVRMVLDAARGIQYLHSKRIIHRDIKSHNFLVDDDWRVKVADFGISKVLENDGNAFTQCGTTGWVAPEVLLDEDLGYTFKADNWSFAVVMWEMVAGSNQNPFIGMAPVKFYNKTVGQGIRPAFPDGVDPDYVELVNACWMSEPSERPAFTEIVPRLEAMAVKVGAGLDLPPTYQGGYHH